MSENGKPDVSVFSATKGGKTEIKPIPLTDAQRRKDSCKEINKCRINN